MLLALLSGAPASLSSVVELQPRRRLRLGLLRLIDLAGYWVAIVSEDWRWRMGAGLKGDYGYLTLSPEGKKVGDGWDPAKDEAAGEQCKTYGAVGVCDCPPGCILPGITTTR